MPSNLIQYTGLHKLAVEEQDMVKRIIDRESLRVTRLVKDVTDIFVTVKVHDTGGARKRYFIFLKAVSPSKVFAVQTQEKSIKKSDEWDLPMATRNAMDKLVFEVKRELKADTEGWKKRAKKAWRVRLNE